MGRKESNQTNKQNNANACWCSICCASVQRLIHVDYPPYRRAKNTKTYTCIYFTLEGCPYIRCYISGLQSSRVSMFRRRRQYHWYSCGDRRWKYFKITTYNNSQVFLNVTVIPLVIYAKTLPEKIIYNSSQLVFDYSCGDFTDTGNTSR